MQKITIDILPIEWGFSTYRLRALQPASTKKVTHEHLVRLFVVKNVFCLTERIPPGK